MTDQDFFCFCGLWILDKAEMIQRKIERCGIAAECDRLKGELDRLLYGEFAELQARAAEKGICLRTGTILAWEKAYRSKR